jgi:competence protein ComEC
MIPVFTYFAVGKGNMALVQFSNGINMLIDSKLSPDRPTPLEYLKAQIKKLHFVVITHPHQDHITGLKDICEYYKPEYMWHNGRYFKPDPVYDDWSYYEALRGGKHGFCRPSAVRNGHTATIGDAKLEVLGPTSPFLEGTPEDENNNGIILRISAGLSSFLLTGDTQEEQWETLNLDELGKVTTFLASHHGRDSGFCEKVLRVMQPQIILISDGEAAEGDATEKYKRFAPVKTTRQKSIVVRPQGMSVGVSE